MSLFLSCVVYPVTNTEICIEYLSLLSSSSLSSVSSVMPGVSNANYQKPNAPFCAIALSGGSICVCASRLGFDEP
ncbi:MAG: hypothetical protein ACRD8W_15985 [Nitrososphaeraceae archaeon]